MRLLQERRGASAITYVYEPGSYVPLARLDAEGEKTEQGGLGTTDDALPATSTNTAKTIAASAHPSSASAKSHSKHAANDAEAQYWASLSNTAQQNAQAQHIEGWGTGTHSAAGNGTTGQADLCKVYYFHTDQVGMPQELTNAQGQIVWQASYKTWGSTVAEEWEIKTLNGNPVHRLDEGDSPSQAEQQQNLRFQGQYLDRDTGLHYNTFRYYDPDMGRFICPDPIGLAGGINLGSYSPNPITWIDPWGWSPCKPETFAQWVARSRGTADVYLRSLGRAVANYVGISKNPATRYASTLGDRLRLLTSKTGQLPRNQASSIEQAIIEAGKPKGYTNTDNSIYPKKPYYDDAVKWGGLA